MGSISVEQNAISPLAVSICKAKVRMEGYEAEGNEGTEDSLKSPHKSPSRTSRASARTRSDSWMSEGAKKRTGGTGLLDPYSYQHKDRQHAQTEKVENVSQVLSKSVRSFCKSRLLARSLVRTLLAVLKMSKDSYDLTYLCITTKLFIDDFCI